MLPSARSTRYDAAPKLREAALASLSLERKRQNRLGLHARKPRSRAPFGRVEAQVVHAGRVCDGHRERRVRLAEVRRRRARVDAGGRTRKQRLKRAQPLLGSRAGVRRGRRLRHHGAQAVDARKGGRRKPTARIAVYAAVRTRFGSATPQARSTRARRRTARPRTCRLPRSPGAAAALRRAPTTSCATDAGGELRPRAAAPRSAARSCSPSRHDEAQASSLTGPRRGKGKTL